MGKVKMAFRRFLLRLLNITSEKETKNPKETEKKQPILFRELNVPVWIVGLVIFIVVIWILWGQFGPGWQSIAGMVLFISIAMFAVDESFSRVGGTKLIFKVSLIV